MNKTYAVIMAGGVGSRFWPMSREDIPKQFHDFLGTGRTLLQMTYDRLIEICGKEGVLVVTNNKYKDLVKEQLPYIKNNQILGEYGRKNTAPCIAYAAFHIQAIEPGAQMIVAPSDHLILKEKEFERVVNKALEDSAKNHLVTLGIKPIRPDTGYGYIQFEKESENNSGDVRKVISFTEKPDKEKAQDFLEKGNYFWNSGIFIWKVDKILKEFKIHLPLLYGQFLNFKDCFGSEKENSAIKDIYKKCEGVSIDYGIMEKAEDVNVVLADVGWSDLGTWGALAEQFDSDDKCNVKIGNTVKTYDSERNTIKSNNGKLTILQGVNDLIIVDTKDVLMVCKKDDEQQIRKIVKKLGEEGLEDFL